MKTAVVIPTFNEGPDLELTVASCVALRPQADHVLVVDDLSWPEFEVQQRMLPFTAKHCVEYLSHNVKKQMQWGNIALHQPPHRLGASASKRWSIDKAIELWNPDAIIVLDSHTRPTMSMVGRFAEVLEEHPAALLCCTCIGFDHGLVGGRMLGGKLTRETLYPEVAFLRDTDTTDAVPIVPAVIGGCYAFKTEQYLKAGGLNPLFMGYGPDEGEWSLRWRLFGGECRAVRDLTVAHNFNRQMVGYHLNGHEIFNNMRITLATLFEDGVWEDVYEQPMQAMLDLLFDRKDPIGIDIAVGWERLKPRVAEWRLRIQAGRQISDAELGDAAGYPRMTKDEALTLVAKELDRRYANIKKLRNMAKDAE